MLGRLSEPSTISDNVIKSYLNQLIRDIKTNLDSLESLILNKKRTFRKVTSGSTIDVILTDDIILIEKTVGSATAVTLPSTPSKTVFTIKDGKGDANTYNITVTPTVGTIDGAASAVISVNYGVLIVFFDGTNWYSI